MMFETSEGKERMDMGKDTQCCGRQSLKFEKDIYIESSSSVVGKKESEGPFGTWFDVVIEDAMAGKDTWEEAESAFQTEAVKMVLEKSGIDKDAIRYVFAGDLLGQAIATSFGLLQFELPLFGLYGACSTSGEALMLSAMTVGAGYAEHVMAVTSSHFASAEKQFRFPLEYGNQRPLSATWTVTGSGAFIVGTDRSAVKISGVTCGKIVDYGVKDSMNMGACMAPAACDTIYQNFQDFKVEPEEYDRIVTGDLGFVGHDILADLLKEKGYDVSDRLTDCGMTIFNDEKQDTHSGGSGCGCAAVMLSANFIRQLQEGTFRKILFVPTGALLSPVSFNEGHSVPGIAHALIIERIEQ